MKKFVSLIAAEDPTQTHHWLLPETAETNGQEVDGRPHRADSG
jgi:hypothetical protein